MPTRHRAAAKSPLAIVPARSGQADARSPESAAAASLDRGGRPVSARDLVALRGAARCCEARWPRPRERAGQERQRSPDPRPPAGRSDARPKATVSPRRELQAAGRRGRPPKYHPTEVVELVDDWKAERRAPVGAAGRHKRSRILLTRMPQGHAQSSSIGIWR